MHIPDGFLSGGVSVATYAASVAGAGYSISKSKELGEKQIPLLGVTAAFVFAAQMLNFPIGGGTSGHFLGAALAAILMGPYAACLALTLVLIIQCFGFADGGLTALGANVFNMGVAGGFGSYLIFMGLKKVLPNSRNGFMIAAGITSWSSVMIASGLCAIELAMSGTSPSTVVLPAMLVTHAFIGVGEAIITTTVISVVYASRPDLLATVAEAR